MYSTVVLASLNIPVSYTDLKIWEKSPVSETQKDYSFLYYDLRIWRQWVYIPYCRFINDSYVMHRFKDTGSKVGYISPNILDHTCGILYSITDLLQRPQRICI